ncbi:DUF2550 domain-containing protein [uncultured Pseudokineococcus sp.]|uniref:DUF2550 domain-containing protein n=1 Tax=uncultured Pseudokineococcus sp. TaxID=1642928 RepID=UPI00262321F8|nr:DUF2550 domain-containing protein [uncultured Pseudokineococcus sp.]
MAVLPLEIALVVLLLVALGVLLVSLRRRVITRRLGAFDCSARREGGRWVLGVAGFRRDDMAWYRVFGVDVGAGRTWGRREIEVVRRRSPEGSEAYAVLPDAVVVECRHREQTLELAMSEEAYTGFASWLESSPPGYRADVA